MKKTVELLAPAKDLMCAIEAVNHGADAVYMGAARFGARSSTGNTIEDVGKAVRYAHRYGASVYITLNTLLYDHELSDTLIIQDIRLLYLKKQHVLPPVPIHASTQMDNATLEKILFLEKEGFDRGDCAHYCRLSYDLEDA